MRLLTNKVLTKQSRVLASRLFCLLPHCRFASVSLSAAVRLLAGRSVDSQKMITRSGSHSSRDRAGMTPEMRASIEQAMGVICTQQKLDPKPVLR